MSKFSNDLYMVAPQYLQKQSENKLSLHYSNQYSSILSDFSVANFTPTTSSNNIFKATEKTIEEVKSIEKIIQ
jgi:hypothetical protein